MSDEPRGQKGNRGLLQTLAMALRRVKNDCQAQEYEVYSEARQPFLTKFEKKAEILD